jgi:hypothetical protein
MPSYQPARKEIANAHEKIRANGAGEVLYNRVRNLLWRVLGNRTHASAISESRPTSAATDI